jgi:cyclic pyranopterin phosphate synthase
MRIVNGPHPIKTVNTHEIFAKYPRTSLLVSSRQLQTLGTFIIMGMIDITGKETVLREAVASGRISLAPETLARIKEHKIKKGDPRAVAEIAAINAAKETARLIPHCHQIPLSTVDVTFSLEKDSIEATCLVKAEATTGVEMEALVGVSMALAVIWDMVKYLEKDESGQYPSTRISDIRVIKKTKKPLSSYGFD